jgi:flavin-dependent dehydrogenase
MTSNGWDFDVAVVGGGPGGSSAATALARRGRSVVLLERERFPRFHIGESQLPWSNEVLRTLGVEEAIAAAGFVRKWGASFRRPDGGSEQYADFLAAVETPSPQTFQVWRQRFDEILLRHAARCGVTVREEQRCLDAAFDAEGVTLRFAGADDVERTARVGAVVDASGRAGVRVKRFGRHEYDPLLRNIAIHAQYEGIPCAEGRRAGDIRMFTRADMGWLWLIPLSDTVMSVGAVIPRAIHRQGAQPTAEASLAYYLADTPAVVPLLERARRTSPARFDADYSYLATRMAGDRWVAVGDAAASWIPSSRPACCSPCREAWKPRRRSTSGCGPVTCRRGRSPGTSVSSGNAITTSGGSPSGSMIPRSVSCGSRPGSDSASTPRSWPSSPGTGGRHC